MSKYFICFIGPQYSRSIQHPRISNTIISIEDKLIESLDRDNLNEVFKIPNECTITCITKL